MISWGVDAKTRDELCEIIFMTKEFYEHLLGDATTDEENNNLHHLYSTL